MKQKSNIFPAHVVEKTDNQTTTVPSLPLHKQSDRIKSELAPIRTLQVIAIAIGLIWIISAIVVSEHTVLRLSKSEFERQNEKVQNQTELIAQLIEKELHLAEQIAITLSHEADILMLAQQMNSCEEALAAMTTAERTTFIKATPQSQTVDALFDRLQMNVDLFLVFLLDAHGYCIASGYMEDQKNGCKLGCWGGNYKQRQYFQQAKRDGEGRQFAVGRRVPEPSLFFARALNSKGYFQGAVIVRIDARKLVNTLREKPSVTWIMDRYGIIISSTNDALLFKHVGKAFHEIPTDTMLKEVYAQKTLKSIPLARDKGSPQSWKMWRLDNAPMVFQMARVQGRDFYVWHGFDVESSLEVNRRNWYFAIVIILSGLLSILIVERMGDFHQRRLANMAELSEVNRSLETISAKLYAIATKDHLTQISSRGFFMQSLKNAIEEAYNVQKTLCFLQLDIDFFKRINDTYGHLAGDAAIRQMAELCRKAIHGRDLVGRLGGEEFAICLIDCDIESALKIAEKLRESVASTPLIFNSVTIKFTCSIGVTPLTRDATPEKLLSISDRALYRAKNSGRNCVKLEGGNSSENSS